MGCALSMLTQEAAKRSRRVDGVGFGALPYPGSLPMIGGWWLIDLIMEKS
jgi:hypothetical protein